MKHLNVSNRRSDNNVTHRLHQGEYVFQILLKKIGIQKNKGNKYEEIETVPFKTSVMGNQTYKVCHQRWCEGTYSKEFLKCI